MNIIRGCAKGCYCHPAQAVKISVENGLLVDDIAPNDVSLYSHFQRLKSIVFAQACQVLLALVVGQICEITMRRLILLGSVRRALKERRFVES
jgi:hypothetical protein